MSNKINKESWDRLSEHYQSKTKISLDDVHYGPYGPGEKKLQVIGDVSGLDVLELGCGGGQNSIVLAKWGAKSVTGVDQSSKQLEYAQRLAESQKVNVRFIQGNMEELSMLEDNSFDLIVSSHAMNYVVNLPKVFTESARVLRPNGRLVTCMGHPIMHLLWEALEEKSFDRIGNYFSNKRLVWDWTFDNGTRIGPFEDTAYRFEDILNGLISAEFSIDRVIEPQGYTKDQLNILGEDEIAFYPVPSNDKFIRVNLQIPFSLIISARKL